MFEQALNILMEHNKGFSFSLTSCILILGSDCCWVWRIWIFWSEIWINMLLVPKESWCMYKALIILFCVTFLTPTWHLKLIFCFLTFQYPERVFTCKEGVTALDFSKAYPNLLAVSTCILSLKRTVWKVYISSVRVNTRGFYTRFVRVAWC